MSAEVSVRVGSIVGFYTPAAKVEQLEHSASAWCKEFGLSPGEVATHISHRRYLATMAFSEHDTKGLTLRFSPSADDVIAVHDTSDSTDIRSLSGLPPR